jgi:hypothetical protein
LKAGAAYNGSTKEEHANREDNLGRTRTETVSPYKHVTTWESEVNQRKKDQMEGRDRGEGVGKDEKKGVWYCIIRGNDGRNIDG